MRKSESVRILSFVRRRNGASSDSGDDEVLAFVAMCLATIAFWTFGLGAEIVTLTGGGIAVPMGPHTVALI